MIKDLIKDNKKVKFKSNLLYIVDSDFNQNMIKIFKDCLKRDEKIIDELNLSFNFYLIYTQPDVALKHFINEKWEKNNEIKNLQNKINEKIIEIEAKNIEFDEKNREFEEKNREFEKKIKEVVEKNKQLEEQNEKILDSYHNYLSEFTFIELEQEIIEFLKKINNKKSLITIGILDDIAENHKYKFTSLILMSNAKIKDLKINYLLIDFKTFHTVELDNAKDNSFCSRALKNYINKMSFCYYFDEFYILVDFLFLKNISEIIKAEKLNLYDINIYLFEVKNSFMIYMKKTNLSLNIIKLEKNTCKNPMFEESENLSIYEVEQFGSNYFNLLKFNNFFNNNEAHYEKGYLFNYKGIINYIFDLYNKFNNKNDNTTTYLVEVIGVKKDMNIDFDRRFKTLIPANTKTNRIYFRKTEFGNEFEDAKLEQIIKYIFNINSIKITNFYSVKDATDNKDNLKIIPYLKLYKGNFLINLKKNKLIMPLYQVEKRINPFCIGLIEYSYFLCLPMLIQKINEKPKILLLVNDYGILNYYFEQIYKDLFNIRSYTQEKNLILKSLNINTENIIEKPFANAIETLKKENKKFDLIIMDYFEKEKNDDESIPNTKNLLNMKALLENKGIFAFNLRINSFLTYNNIISSQKKYYNKVFEINFRIGSKLLICSDENILISNNLENSYTKKIEGIKEFKEDINAIINNNN